MAEQFDVSAVKNLDKETLLEEIAKIESDIAEVSRVRPFVEINLDKTQDRLLAISANLDAIREKANKMAQLRIPFDNLEKGCEDIAYYAELAGKTLVRIADLDQQKNYDEAFAEVEKLRTKFLELDYGISLTTQRAVNEIIGHEKAFLFAHKGENAIAQGQIPLTDEELESYASLAPNLGTTINGEKSRHYHLDKIVGFRYEKATLEFAARPIDRQGFLDMISKNGELEQGGIELSDLANERKMRFHRLLQSTFNDLSTKAFAGDDYEEALFYYEHRDFINDLVVTEESYLLPNETEFHYAFLLRKAIQQNDDQFYEWTKSLHDALMAEDEFTIELIGRIVAAEKLPESHFELVLSELRKTNFEVQVLCFAKGLEFGVSEERQFTLFNTLSHEKKKRGDLEKMGKSLYYIREHIVASQQKEYGVLVKDLMRSPHAKRAATKSGSPAIHALIGEDYDNPKLPIGKREKKTFIKAWDFIVKGLYFGLAVFLPIGVCIGAYPLLLAAEFPDLLRRLILIAPIVLAEFFMMMAIYRRYGFDERGAEGWGLGLGIAGILICGASLVFFILPTELHALAPYCYSILALGATLGICSLLLKQRRSVVRILLTLPLALVVIANAVFIVIDSIQGTL